MLREIDCNLWVVEQPFKYFGLEVGTRMTLVRLGTGDLVAISPIKIDPATIEQIALLGEVKYIIAPNLYHHLFIQNFQFIYPQAQLWATSSLAKKRPDLVIDIPIAERQNSMFDGEIDCLLFDGFQTLFLNGYTPLNEYVFCHQSSRTLILTDTAFYFDESFVPLTQLIAKLTGGYKLLRPSPLEKLATRDKQAVKKAVDRVLEWDFDRVIVAHGSIVETNGKEQFKSGYDWFLNT
ncbi:DUF4336 domain-containing protein [Chamaesiphon sp. OTE_8_metabat_110]|uniref:DUF4336 domain-containing protein n=1 Tax=Chamaesiphon sp. OTE_8_metabat_110 TaxID=2964696 RepID=UPI00286AB915|nr:DUF4336 domain-containing protein [Chamaesiphon sp. OTE_8_metabat_110]